MIQYGCVAVTAGPNEDVVPLIFKELTGNIPKGGMGTLQFVGFEAPSDTSFKLNKIPNRVPSNEYFITPFDGTNHMRISSLSFDEGCSGIKIWFAY